MRPILYDGRDQTGRPIANRTPLSPDLRDRVLFYLESAPVILAAGTLYPDEFTPTDHDVPLNYRTDGTWIWAGAVPHYLRKHDFGPQPELVDHIRALDFEPAPVDAPTRQRAVAAITSR
jgi:hypothetical protein